MRDLNVKQLEALSKPGTYRVSKSLYLQIGPAGTKAWLFRYMKDGVAHGMGLGPLDLVTLAEARDKALLCRRMLFDGKDPLEERRGKRLQALLATAGKVTFKTCTERYIDAHATGWRNRKHRQQWTSTLTTYAYPVMGDLPVGVIDTGLVMQVLEPIWQTKTQTASRVRGRMRASWIGRRHATIAQAKTRRAGVAIWTSCCPSARRWPRSTTMTPCPMPSCRRSCRSCAVRPASPSSSTPRATSARGAPLSGTRRPASCPCARNVRAAPADEILEAVGLELGTPVATRRRDMAFRAAVLVRRGISQERQALCSRGLDAIADTNERAIVSLVGRQRRGPPECWSGLAATDASFG